MIHEIQLEINPYNGLLEPEVWKDIPGHEGSYLVSNYGRVKSLPRISIREYADHVRRYRIPEILLQQADNGKGYLYVNLFCNKVSKKFCVHRLVAELFQDNHDKLSEINHEDGNKQNNFYINLKWATRSANVEHSYRTGLHTGIGETHQFAKLNLLFVRVIREALSLGHSQYRLAKYFKVGQTAIANIKLQKTWKHEGTF